MKAVILSLMYLGTYFECIPVNQLYQCALPSRQPHHRESIQHGKNPSRNSGSNFLTAFDFPTEYMRPLHSYVSGSHPALSLFLLQRKQLMVSVEWLYSTDGTHAQSNHRLVLGRSLLFRTSSTYNSSWQSTRCT